MDQKEQRLAALRTRAEAAFKKVYEVPSAISTADLDEIIHELNVYHIELEIQLEDMQQSYRAMEEAQRRYANLFDFAPVGYMITGAQGVIINANLTLSSMLGVARESLEKTPFTDFITPDYQDIYHLSRRAVIQTGQPHSCEVQVRRADGTVFYAQLNTELPDSYASALRTAVINTTILKQAEESLRRALSYEREINDLRTRVLSVIDHEFRTPLAIILSSVELLQHYGDQLSVEAKEKRFQAITKAVWYLTETVEDANSITSVDGQPLLKLEPFDIVSFTQQMVVDLGSIMNAKARITLQINAAGASEQVSLDRSLMQRIMTNLIANALKYSDGAVEIRLDVEASQVRLAVADKGVGISINDQVHMYEPFYRGQNLAASPGKGIGLFVVQRAVHAHGGTIRCESQIGQGTTFIVELPREAAPRP